MGYFRDRFLTAFTIESSGISSLDDVLYKVLEKRSSVEKEYKVLLQRLPIYADEDTYVNDLKVIRAEKFRFLPLSFGHEVTLRKYLESLKEEGKIDTIAYQKLLSSIPSDRLESPIFYSYIDVIIYEGSSLTVVTSLKHKDAVELYLSTILGTYKESFLSLGNIHDFILWIIHKHYLEQKIDGLLISDITFQRREETGMSKLKKVYDHKGPHLIYSDEVLLGIAKAFNEFTKAAKIRVSNDINELEFYIEDRNGVLVFYPILKGYNLSYDEKDKYNSIYRKIKATYSLIYEILPILTDAYKNDENWDKDREQLIKEANKLLRERLEEIIK